MIGIDKSDGDWQRLFEAMENICDHPGPGGPFPETPVDELDRCTGCVERTDEVFTYLSQRRNRPQVHLNGYWVVPTGWDESDNPEKHIFTVEITDRGENQWAVLWHGECLTRDGEWEYEPRPSSRDNDFKARCRFPRDEAIRRAVEVVDGLTINGRTFAEWETIRAERNAERGSGA